MTKFNSEDLQPKYRKPPPCIDAVWWDSFLRSKKIARARISEIYNIPPSTVHSWFRPGKGIPPKHLPKLEEIKKHVEEWEAENGRWFNT